MDWALSTDAQATWTDVLHIYIYGHVQSTDSSVVGLRTGRCLRTRRPYGPARGRFVYGHIFRRSTDRALSTDAQGHARGCAVHGHISRRSTDWALSADAQSNRRHCWLYIRAVHGHAGYIAHRTTHSKHSQPILPQGRVNLTLGIC